MALVQLILVRFVVGCERQGAARGERRRQQQQSEKAKKQKAKQRRNKQRAKIKEQKQEAKGTAVERDVGPNRQIIDRRGKCVLQDYELLRPIKQEE